MHLVKATPERIQQVMVHAQLDLAMLVRYLVGLNDTFNVEAAQRTLEELHELTGDEAGIDLMYRELDIG